MIAGLVASKIKSLEKPKTLNALPLRKYIQICNKYLAIGISNAMVSGMDIFLYRCMFLIDNCLQEHSR
jgi:hypothetical protein